MDRKEELFREQYLFTQEDILNSVELLIEHEEHHIEPKYSPETANRRVKLWKKFLASVKKCKLPVLSALWWFYDYQFSGDCIELNLCNADEIDIEDDLISSISFTCEHTVLSVECDYLTVEQFAAVLGVEPVTVRQWIRRGKLRYAKKSGQGWLIPEIEDKPQRGFTSVQYVIEDESHIESDVFPMLSACDLVSIFQDDTDKKKYICIFENTSTNLRNEISLTRSEVERLEYAIIKSGKAKVITGA